MDVLEGIEVDTYKNISYYSSILTCILEYFDKLDKNDQTICIKQFNAKLLTEVRKKKGLEHYTTTTLVWDKKDLVKNLTDFNIISNIIAFTCVYFNINIFVISERDILLFC